MLMTTPDSDTLYEALLTRNPAYDGQIFVGVSSTGVFCRLSCPARKPKQENCRFFDSAAACLGAGFRPCKRCNPLAHPEPMVTRLIDALEANPTHRWSEADIKAMGVDPSTLRRAFKRAFGLSFLEMARHRRLAAGFSTLAEGGRVIDAQLDAGFDSPDAFRQAVTRLLGLPPGQLRSGGPLTADWIATPLGPMIAVASLHALHLLEFIDRKGLPKSLQRLLKDSHGRLALGRNDVIDQVEAQLTRFFDGTEARFDIPLRQPGTPFQQQVWTALQTIPAGTRKSYSDLATILNRPEAVRAVARANGANTIAILVPCHRITGADGALTGYGGGLWRKDQLLKTELSYARPPQETP
ncbi:methylated-DNA--[protein]-cysteine S-methyltransferase [Roseobacter sp. HKCCD9010]|uniref:bifunctional transcriptional activator/DNA repair enzyme AdaA n=1 Tax=unclassified Roseobacter TaxID=196798 RepID=UPI0014920C61|nr:MULTISPECIES: trifunctional transcriptional activator/DNA repair protein Ada/methylated-DNA--[protein]-cysteine S-methyltransferase [unclassified Roseobacter]MBF9050180.1 methylated-DNA--[protein]-cysteine S-methyltransferase [Rhodobacterales bacterium HKCCD4356]NNV12423.1 methylated-DNA--[protein]-cysteine S-methyltransferase [Roseobacter sp. HKCCD7357]NNV16113.1 methylated-DNA--[protein]-cysteine S-methyltransferase [Roseobacter sp. HKCCD8768]NNV25573.1 methylated-DNA--[protein]-cysteine S